MKEIHCNCHHFTQEVRRDIWCKLNDRIIAANSAIVGDPLTKEERELYDALTSNFKERAKFFI